MTGDGAEDALAARRRERILAALRKADAASNPSAAEREAAMLAARRMAARFGFDIGELSRAAAAGEQRGAASVSERARVVLDGEHAFRGLQLLWSLADVLDVDVQFIDLRTQALAGERADVELLVRAHREAFAALEERFTGLVAGLLDEAARVARRYVTTVYPDPTLHDDVTAQLRYWPEQRLAAAIASALPVRPAAARRAAAAVRAGRVAAADVEPEALERSYWPAAIDTITDRMRALDDVRNPGRRRRHQPVDETPLMADARRRSSRPARRRRRAPAAPAWSPEAAAAGGAAAEAAAIGLQPVRSTG